MNTIKDFKDIFATSFSDPASWRDWFISSVVSPEDIMLLQDGSGRAVSALLMQPYTFLYQGQELPSVYLSCIGTRPEARAKGHAGRLICQALERAHSQGVAFAELIPAQDHLYFFYGRFGFGDAFYLDYMRYTGEHPFEGGEGSVVEPSFEIFSGLERRFGCGVLHSETDYRNILHDMYLDGGAEHIAVQEGEEFAILFATSSPSDVNVKLLLADTPRLATAALRELRARVGNKNIEVHTPPLSGEKAFLRARGMVRVINVHEVLSALASRYPELDYTVSVHDDLLPENDGTYHIANGKCSTEATAARPDIDVDVSTLSSILFSSDRTGKIFDLPTRRPLMALMLD